MSFGSRWYSYMRPAASHPVAFPSSHDRAYHAVASFGSLSAPCPNSWLTPARRQRSPAPASHSRSHVARSSHAPIAFAIWTGGGAEGEAYSSSDGTAWSPFLHAGSEKMAIE